MLMRHGYGVLLVNPRGQGRSQGDISRWAGDHDLIAAAEYLQGRPDVDPGGRRLGLLDRGEQLLGAAARSKAFAGVVSDGAGSRVGDDDEFSDIGKVLVARRLRS